MKTEMGKADNSIRKWYVVDAEGKVLGRLSSEIAKILIGKNKPDFTPGVDTGDFVIVINAEKVVLTGNKLEQKIYRHHSLYPGGMKETKYKQLMETKPEKVIELAVKGMLPKNSLGRAMYRKLKVVRGAQHDHAAQLPVQIDLSI
jgi:large subunit ribosomal protein L13